MNRPVKSADVHSVPFVQGVGQLKGTLGGTEHTGMKMNAVDQGIIIEYKGAFFIVPWGNIKSATFSGPDTAETIRAVDAAKVPAEGANVANQSAFRVVPKVA